ncbi:hypothetical protein K432DRAFT_421019 [Lepidopterella palustris CBS 459.81]|uniref:Septation initiation network scaffold protein cdc11 n=1 Tax=Lepidopterella palustris CBS 459.81 TaxID=1314670 RepID=A0A8E2EM28_9PEZI|nr:hypothetical protein K432DRAFT_421019 [Lepidopterella palustris CBS 459.81]
MPPWLDDLSEDWIPQSRSSSPPLIAAAVSSATHNSGDLTSQPRSKLPRFRISSTSFSPVKARPILRQNKTPDKRRSALGERSKSENNIVTNSSPAQDKSGLAQSRQGSCSFSGSSIQSVVHHEIAEQKPLRSSPEKAGRIQDTPEWKRRLLKGDMGYRDQRDLFSPMGLENIFQKPSGTPQDRKKPKGALQFLNGLDAMPSSPPPWPSAEHETRKSSGMGFKNYPNRKPVSLDEEQEQLDLSKFGQTTEDIRKGGLNNEPDFEQYRLNRLSTKQHRSHTSMSRNASNETDVEQAFLEASRTTSGQLELENESFSPVFISKHNTVDGRVDYAALDSSKPGVVERLKRFAHVRDESGNSSFNVDNQSENTEGSSYARLQEDTLPEDLPVGTPDAADVGGFVTTKRGGYSADGSFQKRPLSPSPRSQLLSDIQAEPSSLLGDTHLMNTATENENGFSEIPPQAPSPPPTVPVTPFRRPDSKLLSPERTRSSGSPLKLFGDHDTFTSNRLHRRLSQLEDNPENHQINNMIAQEAGSPRKIHKEARLTSVEEVSIQKITTIEAEVISASNDIRESTSRRETFGQGQLDEYEFPDDLPLHSLVDSSMQDDVDSNQSPPPHVAPPGSHPQFLFRVDSSPPSRDTFSKKRKSSRKSSKASVDGLKNRPVDVQKTLKVDSNHSNYDSARTAGEIPFENAEGKRPPTSPFKNPTPKRRRTLNINDVEDESRVKMKSVKESHVAMQSVIGRKRKDARQDTSHNIADPEVLARRTILRPRNPTPSQRRRDGIEAEILEATEAFLLSSPRLHAIQEHLNSPTAAGSSPDAIQATTIAGEVAAFSLKMANGMNDEGRKRSVTTQDFLDEAVKIMEFIRTKGRPTSGLGSLEEMGSESPSRIEGDSAIPSTPLTFSRPPSREGATGGWRIPPNRQEMDPRVVSHLRKFQEKDSDEFMASSIRSLRFGRATKAAKLEDDIFSVEDSNIRITENRNHGRSGSDLTQRNFGSVESVPGTNRSHPSGSSFGRTVVTNTSRRSDHVATLAPEAVAHLIPEEVAGMGFDREKGIWVRRKSPAKECKQFADISATNESEDDPLGNIPDLTVDEIKELTIKYASRNQAVISDTAYLDASINAEPQDKSRPETRDGKVIPPADTSSAPSKSSNFTWSGPQIETRATSWSEQDVNTIGREKHHLRSEAQAAASSGKDEVEHEIQIHEGRTATVTASKTHRLRDITVSFSSPYGTRMESASGKQENYGENGDYDEGANTNNHITSRDFGTKAKTKYCGSAWRGASGMATFKRGVVPQIDEHGELTILDNPADNRRMTFSVSLSAPISGQVQNQDGLIPTPPTPCGIADVTFMLSDLPDFTVNQIDECELPDRVVVQRNGSTISRRFEDRYALGTAELVKALQDVEPDEPYWEDLYEVDLHGKGLTNLNRLDKFCCRLEDLDVSNNAISQLSGAPSNIRRLKAQGNILTSLTPWGHLMNLQYLDVSGNKIDSLKGFNRLIHLRTLKVDDNNIKCLEGILELDGLMELSVQRNQIEFVDFELANLKSLLDLNLRGNGLLEVRNVQYLPHLQHLNLDDNSIGEFPAPDIASSPCRTLRSLRLCNNELTSLNVGGDFPNLESLHIDKNLLPEIIGLERLKYLRTLSARGQLLEYTPGTSNIRPLVQNSEIRSLYLSANTLPAFQMAHDFLNLQRLELASSGLQSLPSNFGQLTPNIRFLNLNFNALKDLRPLLNIKKLNELFLAGNRLSRLRKNLAVLSKLTTVTKLDLRENPLTIGFYPTVVENRIVSLKGGPSQDEELEPYTLPASDRQTDQQYLARLDEDTRLRRRVHEMLLASSCRSLRELDGLPFDSQDALVKDEVWERLRYLGVIRKSTNSAGVLGG